MAKPIVKVDSQNTDDRGCNQQTHGLGKVIQVTSQTVTLSCVGHIESAAHPDDERSTSHDADKDTRGFDGPRQAAVPDHPRDHLAPRPARQTGAAAAAVMRRWQGQRARRILSFVVNQP